LCDHLALHSFPTRRSSDLLYFDGHSGELLGDFVPWQGTAADIFVQAQFPVHSGRILGLPGRILISIMGVVVAMLSITGIIIWRRDRKSTRLNSSHVKISYA